MSQNQIDHETEDILDDDIESAISVVIALEKRADEITEYLERLHTQLPIPFDRRTPISMAGSDARLTDDELDAEIQRAEAELGAIKERIDNLNRDYPGTRKSERERKQEEQEERERREQQRLKLESDQDHLAEAYDYMDKHGVSKARVSIETGVMRSGWWDRATIDRESDRIDKELRDLSGDLPDTENEES